MKRNYFETVEVESMVFVFNNLSHVLKGGGGGGGGHEGGKSSLV